MHARKISHFRSRTYRRGALADVLGILEGLGEGGEGVFDCSDDDFFWVDSFLVGAGRAEGFNTLLLVIGDLAETADRFRDAIDPNFMLRERIDGSVVGRAHDTSYNP